MEHSQQYQLGPWLICPQTNTISNTEDSHAIDNKSMQVLLMLIQHAGEQVTKNQIFDNVWKNSVVADDILSVTVSKIRKVLGDNARRPSFIKTLPGVGYVLVADVSKIGEVTPQKTEKLPLARIYIGGIFLMLVFSLTVYVMTNNNNPTIPSLNISSIAVLPFDDLSTSQDNQHFTDGLPDAIINQLSQVRSLKVISRYSSFNYRGNYNATEVGQALKVEALLDGSVQKVGEQIRINVRVFSTRDGQQLWSSNFDASSQDIFELQDDISAAVQKRIQPDYKVTNVSDKSYGQGLGKTINAQAYEWYLMGQFHWRQKNPVSLVKAVNYFKRSLEIEPNYAEAHVGLGISYAFLHHFGNWGERKAVDMALPHINKALELKPDSAVALAAKGLILTDKANNFERRGQLDVSLYQQAQEAFERSLELDDSATTHSWYSTLLRLLGKEPEYLKHMNRAIELNPLSASLKRTLSFYLQSKGEQDSAQRLFQQALRLEDDYFSKVVDVMKMNRYSEESIMATVKWQRAHSELFTACSSAEYCEELGFLYLSLGMDQSAQRFLSKLMPYHLHYRVFLNAISAAENGNALSVVSGMKRLYEFDPTSRLKLFQLAVAHYRAGEYQSSKNKVLQLYPDWSDKANIEQIDVNADNYSAMTLYAATLLHLDGIEIANPLLSKIQTFLDKGRVYDKTQVEFSLAEISALLGNIPQALIHLKKALEMGWLESYNREWWSLRTNHFLTPLFEEPEFKLLLKQHQQRRGQLREQVGLQIMVNN